MRIFLTGFMGSGKSYTGRRLARLCQRPFIDLDDWIEERKHATISELFSTHGEDYFRRLESESLRSFENLDYFVLATGGGAPCFHGNMEWMNEHGLTVFIDPPVEVLVARLENEREHRPLLASGDDLRKMIDEKLSARRQFYATAQIHIRPQNPNADVARLILDNLPLTEFH